MKLKFDKKEILEKAMKLFWEHGYQHCSMTILKKELDLSASSIYHTWGSKKGLFSEAMALYGQHVTIELANALDKEEDGYNAIVRLFEFIISYHTQENSQCWWGCLSTNTIAEMAYKNENIADQASKLAVFLEKAFERAIIRGQQQKTINDTHKPNAMASFLMSILHGIHIRVKTNQDVRTNLKNIMPIIKDSLK